ncbi:hypothetical protein CCP3SC15_180001 [Gammaproteobacteria bacterium]
MDIIGIPGFQFRISDLSSKPSPEVMLEDPVYRDFVLPAWQRDKQCAKEAEQRAKEAEQRAQTEAAMRLESEQRAKEAEQRAQTEAAMRLESEQRAKEAEQRAQSEIARLKALLGLPG